MACIKTAQRSMVVAVAPDAPYLVAGTMASDVDLSWSFTASLEMFKLDFRSNAPDMPLIVSIPSSCRFNRLSWSKPILSDEFSLGLVAGGLGDGSIGVWNPQIMISSRDQNGALVGMLEKHVGSVRGLEFCTISPNMLASGGDKGELCIWDLAKPFEPNLFPPLKSAGSCAQTELSSVSWNRKFQHILASTSYNGITLVWDLRQQQPVARFSNSKRRCSVLQWSPEFSTQLVIASDDDNSPSLRVWDVRNTKSPAKEFVGHTKGVVAMSWCPYDYTYLLTCGKDNRTICWDTHSGEIASELPASTNWNVDVHWCPQMPGVISASSSDGKIGIYNIQASVCCRAGDVPFGAEDIQARLTAPKCTKLVPSCTSSAAPNNPDTNSVCVHDVVTENASFGHSTELEVSIKLKEKEYIQALCNRKSLESSSEEERETWGLLRIMFGDGDSRMKLLSHLGFNVPNIESPESINNLVNSLLVTLTRDAEHKTTITHLKSTDSPFLIGNRTGLSNKSRPASVYGNTMSSKQIGLNSGSEESNNNGEVQEVLDGSSFSPVVDESIYRALIVGDFHGAVSHCVSANRMADALVIANIGGEAFLWDTINKYLKSNAFSYLETVSSRRDGSLMTIISTCPLNSWKEMLAVLCLAARGDEWCIMCDTLASRLLTVGDMQAASLCYICAGNIDKTVEIWSKVLKDDTTMRVDLLQGVIEKTITLAFAIGKIKLCTSVSKLIESYAELLANQGRLSTAMVYSTLLGSTDDSFELAFWRERIAFYAETERVASESFPSEQQPASNYRTDQSSLGVFDSHQGPSTVPQMAQHEANFSIRSVPQMAQHEAPIFGLPSSKYASSTKPAPRVLECYPVMVGAEPSTKTYAPPSTPQEQEQLSIPQMAQHAPPMFESLSAPGMAQHEAPMFGLSSTKHASYILPPPTDFELYPSLVGAQPSTKTYAPPSATNMAQHEAPMFGSSSVPRITPREAPMFGLSSIKYASYIKPPPTDFELYPSADLPNTSYLPRATSLAPPNFPTMTHGTASHQYALANSTNSPASQLTHVPSQQMQDQQFFTNPNLSWSQRSSPTMLTLQQQSLPDISSLTLHPSQNVGIDMNIRQGPARKKRGRFFGLF